MATEWKRERAFFLALVGGVLVVLLGSAIIGGVILLRWRLAAQPLPVGTTPNSWLLVAILSGVCFVVVLAAARWFLLSVQDIQRSAKLGKE